MTISGAIDMDSNFNPTEYYESYPAKVISRPGYPARASYKSTLLWRLYGHHILESLAKIKTYADIGGCFGFGANSMSFQIFKSQGSYPKTIVYEISEDFIKIGKRLFPYIDFVQEDLTKSDKSSGKIFDLISLFDVVEHIPEPENFLSSLAKFSKYAMLITPTETSGDWFGAKPPKKTGQEHSDGHVNFFTPKSYSELLKDSGWQLIDGKFIISLANITNKQILMPEQFDRTRSWREKLVLNLLLTKIVPFSICRKIIGNGFHIGLFKSLEYDYHVE